MELWQLRTFLAVAKTLHFTRASEELNLSQPAVSHQIRALEEEIGEPLFLRQKEGISLTRAGHTMLLHAEKILNTAEDLRREIAESAEYLGGKVSMGTVTRGLDHPFASLYGKFRQTHPEIEVTFISGTRLEEIVENVRNGTIDIGFATHGVDIGDLVSVPFGHYKIALAVGENHRFFKQSEVSLEELENQDWILFERGNRLRTSCDEALYKAGISPKSVYETNDGSLIESMVRMGDKMSLLPVWSLNEGIRDGKIKALYPEGLSLRIGVSLIWQKNKRSKAMSALLNYLLEHGMEGIETAKSKDCPPSNLF
jgi:LysR family transcriptional regulator, cyn operon transcriptional activator